MAQQNRGLLSARQLGDFAKATIANAVELLRDTEGLASFDRPARAYALAILAAEEYGKHTMCFGMIGRDQVHPDAWDTFWRVFTRHTPKYENAVLMAALHLRTEEVEAFSAEFDRHVAADQSRKLAGLYVDWVDGEVKTPSEVIMAGEVEALLIVFTSVIYQWAEFWDGTDFAAMFKANEADAVILQQALATGDPEEIQRVWDASAPGVAAEREPAEPTTDVPDSVQTAERNGP